MRRGVYNKFNRGELDSKALLRDDVEKVNNSCSLSENLLPQRLGPTQYRSGTRFISTFSNATYHVPFVARTDDTAIIALADDHARLWVDDALVIKPQGTLTLANQEFTSNLTSWTDDSGVGSSTSWGSSGTADLYGARDTSAKLWQTFAGTGAGVEHSVLIEIEQAPLEIRVGESGANSFDILKVTLEPGIHQLVFTPVGNTPTITLVNSNNYRGRVLYVRQGDGAVLELATPSDISELGSIRWAQSADVIFFATSSTPQFKVERRGKKSWSIVDFRMDDGPFDLINNTDTTMTISNLEGNGDITASDDYFKLTDVGRIITLTSASQRVETVLTAEDTGTDSIRVTGVESPVRRFKIETTGNLAGTLTLQRSTDDKSWQDVESYSGNKNKFYNDKLDNAILYYRLWIKVGDYTSGSVSASLNYENGSKDGIARITNFNSSTSVGAQILKNFGETVATKDWSIGEWGKDGKFPTAVALYEGRLWWAGLVKLWGSVSDEYASFDDELEGDSAPIRRTIGFGPVDRVDWIAASARLMVGLASDEITVRSSSFGEVLSESNCNLKSGSTQGVAAIEPLKVDDSLLFVQRSGVKIMDAAYSLDTDNHGNTDMMTLNPSICSPGIVRMAASRQPETRVYVVLADGTMRVHLQDPAEDVVAWSRITMNGLIKDVIVLPGLKEDVVYISIERNGVLNLERFSRLADMVTEHFDSSVLYSSPGSGVLTGLDHLNGETVGVWADGQDRGTFTVAAGSINVTTTYTTATVGLPYVARYKSNKISQYMATTSGITRVVGMLKRVVDLNMVMEDYWPGSVRVGPDFTLLEDMPLIEFGKLVDTTAVIAEYDEHPFEFNGNDDVDPRICIEVTGPAVLLGMSYGVLTEDEVKE